MNRGALAVAAVALFGAAAVAEPARMFRQACSGKRRCHAWIEVNADGSRRSYAVRDDMPPPLGFGPADLQNAYAIDPTLQPNATIAVIDAFGYPTLEADLATYRAQFGLPACTSASGCLTIINQNGQTSPLPAENMTQNGQGWEAEAALDLDMASAACPNCKLIAVEANDDSDNGLDTSNDAAVAAGATVVSNSWGTSESGLGSISDADAHYDHPGVAVFASTGDDGHGSAGEGFPATSDHVIAVGGTRLMLQPGGSFTEQAWGGAGSTCSQNFGKPSWQPSSSCGDKRATADVSAVADPGTGVAVFVQNTWSDIGGTSASSPLVAGIFAATGHGDATPQYPYANASFFTDIVTGANGTCSGSLCNAGTGWDGPTGMGSPIGASMTGAKLPLLAAAPANNATVPPGFEVLANCLPRDSATVTEVDVALDGNPLAALHAAPYIKSMPATLANGPHSLSVRCKLSSQVFTSVTMNVVQTAPCGSGSSDSTCSSGELCFDGACLPGPSIEGGLGTACTLDTQCASAICAGSGAAEQCVIPCDASMACPAGYACDPTALVCAGPEAVHIPSGCAAGGGGPVLLLGFGAALVVSRRRKPS